MSMNRCWSLSGGVGGGCSNKDSNSKDTVTVAAVTVAVNAVASFNFCL